MSLILLTDVFNMFKEANNGSFKESVASDVVGMLNLYEASYAGNKEDKILDEAISFTTKHLRAALPNMEPLLAERVAHSLELPLHKRLQRLRQPIFKSREPPLRAASLMCLVQCLVSISITTVMLVVTKICVYSSLVYIPARSQELETDSCL